MKKSIIKIFIAIILLTLILSIGNDFFEISDIYTVFALLLCTAILLLISDYQNKTFVQNTSNIRTNLFFIATIMSFIKIYSVFSYNINGEVRINEVILSFKPIIISMYIYILFINIFSSYSSKQSVDIKTDNNDINKLDLTRREREVFELILKDFSNKEIADNLFIAETTVKKHVQNILKKCNCTNRTEIIDNYSIKH